MSQTYPKRLIEVDLPIARISAHARREKSIRHGHISTLHIWWARRPLAACRAVICASLWPDPADELCPPAFREAAATQLMAFAHRMFPARINDEGHQLQATASPESRGRWEGLLQSEKEGLPLDPTDAAHQQVMRGALLDFIADFANWDNSTVPAYLETSRALTQAAHEALGGVPGTRPLVVDPFAGGGSIPLEASRVGGDAFASDLNPIPVILNKVLLEYIPKYGEKLVNAVEHWSEFIFRKASDELVQYYPNDENGNQPLAYLWAKTILSDAPGQGEHPIEVPLMRSMWLAKRRNGNWAFRWKRGKSGEIETEQVDVDYADGQRRRVRRPLFEIFQPVTSKDLDPGTSRGGAATCPISEYTTSVETVREQLSRRSGGSSDARITCVVTDQVSERSKAYRYPTKSDYASAHLAGRRVAELERQLGEQWALPSGQLNHLRGFFNVVLYGMKTWKDLFAPRQQLALLTLAHLISKIGKKIAEDEDYEFASAVQTCLAMAMDRFVDYSSNLCVWASTGEFVCHTFGRQALPMVWDFAEVNPLAPTGWNGACDWVLRVLRATEKSELLVGQSQQASALSHPLPNDSADAVITDPPYYAAIPYADLSDFFYSWMRLSIGEIHGRLFLDELAPKEDECVSLAHRASMYRHKDAAWFEQSMTKACDECRRIAKPTGIAVVVFANKETSGWEAMLAAILSAGWVVTASWPIDTERAGRLRAIDSAALASSVHLVCRPRENESGEISEETGEWRDVLSELPKRIHEWMPRLAAEGVVGADAIFACLGPALEIFSRYSRVEKASGEAVPLREYLEQVWATVSTEALSMIFKDADAAGLEPDARLTAMWLWTLGGMETNGSDSKSSSDSDEKVVASKGYTLEYDAARKIAQGLGVHLEQSDSIVEVSGDKARLLPVSERTRHLFGKDEATTTPRGKKKKPKSKQLDLFKTLAEIEAEAEETIAGELKPQAGETVLDRVHQSMILFASGRGEALRRFLVDDGAGNDARFWKLAQSLSALYPKETDEKRWVDGVLARKKGLGL